MPLRPNLSLSRGGRPIGPVYNDTNRAARKLKRQGFDRAAEVMAVRGAEEQLAGGDSNITSADSNLRERDARETIGSGLMRTRRDSLLKQEAQDKGLTVEATGSQLTARQGLYERMRGGVTPEMKTEAGKLGITDSGFAQASASAAKNPLAPAAPAAPASTLTRPSTPAFTMAPRANAGYDADNNGIPNSLQPPARPAAPAAPAPVGKIDGMPASQAIGAAQTRVNQAATQGRIDTMGLAGAVADYHKRWNSPQEPGNMDDIRKRDAVSPPAPASTAVGPAQQAMNEALARNAGRAFNAGINNSTLPSLTQGLTSPESSPLGPTAPGRSLARPVPATPTVPATTTPTGPASTPTATLTRPAPPSDGRRGAASDFMKANAVSLQAERLKREKEEAEKSRTTRAAQIATARTLVRVTSRSY